MPVIVVGADTESGKALVEGLVDPEREVRAFVSDGDAAAEFRAMGVKVALGDVSDDSHVQGASMNCFTVVLVTEAARDGRERSFARRPEDVLAGWARAAAACGVTRVIWVHDGDAPGVATPEVRTVSPANPDLVATVIALDDARALPSEPDQDT